MGRWYLADVEVVRDIAERFKLFLGPDEMEFLADDALTFAYEGVTRMQQGWVNAQKKKRRHRRAAADSARRKDTDTTEPELEPEPRSTRELEAPRPALQAPTSELAKKLAAIAAAEAAASEPVGPSRRLTWAEVEAQEADTVDIPAEPARAPARTPKRIPETPAPATGRKLRTRRNEEPEILPAPAPVPEPLLEPIVVAFEPLVTSPPSPVFESPVQDEPIWSEPTPSWPANPEDGPEPTWVEPSWIEPEPIEPTWPSRPGSPPRLSLSPGWTIVPSG